MAGVNFASNPDTEMEELMLEVDQIVLDCT